MTEYQFYALTTVILFFKMFANSIVQGIGRVNSKTFVTAEDAEFFAHVPPAPDEAPIVKRAAMAWRNDLEHIPTFLFLGLIYVTLGCWPEGAYIYFTIFATPRIMQTLLFLRGLQPWRTISYGFGLTICFVVSFHILGAVL